jgi:putative PIN family toxin of toxin-antitoxin system
LLRVTADTNIYISGPVYRRGKPYQFLQLALSGGIELAISQPIIDEIVDVLSRKFGMSQEDIAEAREIVRDAARLDVIKKDPSDNRILECAVAAGSDYIISGDKDLARLGQYGSIFILSVSEFLGTAQGQGR